jgi:hypothetical protein
MAVCTAEQPAMFLLVNLLVVSNFQSQDIIYLQIAVI